MTIGIGQLARAYRIQGEVIDYGEGRDEGILIAAGAGLMMAAMDQRHYRWAMDVGGGRASDPAVLSFLEAVGHAYPIEVQAWWTVTSPTALDEILRQGVDVRGWSYPQLSGIRTVCPL